MSMIGWKTILCKDLKFSWKWSNNSKANTLLYNPKYYLKEEGINKDNNNINNQFKSKVWDFALVNRVQATSTNTSDSFETIDISFIEIGKSKTNFVKKKK